MGNAVLDFYDDFDGAVLRNKIPFGDLPQFVKKAEHLTEDKLRLMPNDNFALVMVDRGRTIRKYACSDKGNTALSVIYFMENKDALPLEAQKVAAVNLLGACKDYELAPPEDLVKLALVGAALGTAMMAPIVLGGVRKHKRTMQAVRRGVPGGTAIKEADMTGSSIMPIGKNPMGKTASLRNVVDITGKSAPIRIQHEEVGENYCMEKCGQAMYPINSASQVEQAADYFNRNRASFTPFERHQYCIKLAARADLLGISVDDDIQKYGSTKFANDVKIAVYRRQRHFREGTSEHGLLQEMMDKFAQVKPEFLATALERFDLHTGIDVMWDAGIPDPYYSVFGVQKVAEWSFQHGNDLVNEQQLKKAVEQSRSQIRDRLGDEACLALQKNPVQIFDSLPLDHKRIIMRLASDN